MADCVKNGINRLLTPSHSRLIAYKEGLEPENSCFITTDHYGISMQTNLFGGINNKFNIPFGLLNNKSYFDGNCFAMSTGLEITQKFINEYLNFSVIPSGQASIPIIENGLNNLQNVSAGLESCFYAIKDSDSFLKKIYARYYNSFYLPFCIKIASKRDHPGSTYCVDSSADILLTAIKLINNKEYIKSHKFTELEIKEVIKFLEAGKHWTFDLPIMLMQMNWNTGIFTNDVKVVIES